MKFPAPLLAAMALSACATTSQPIALDDAGPVTIRVIGLNDFHGNLQPLPRPLRLTSDAGEEISVPVAGAAFLGSAIAAARAKNEHSLVISAGDLIGGSPNRRDESHWLGFQCCRQS
jgi:5'-nucleotidase